MSGEKSFKKRFGFHRTNTSGDPAATAGSSSGAAEGPGGQAAFGTEDPNFGDSKGVIEEDVRNISEVEANRKLKAWRADFHHFDPNLPLEAFDAIDDATAAHDGKLEADLVGELVENSPYPEVRAVVRNYDEDVPVSTIRAWTIGLILTTVCSGINALFILRYPPIGIGPYVVQLIAYPMGVGWAKVMPDKQIKLGPIKFNLNPGPFNTKEHVIIVAMANASFGGGSGYFIDTVVTLRKFYHFSTAQFGWGFNLLFAFSTQCLGFGLAGSVRRWIVEPAAMIWPGALVNVAFMYALHDHSPSDPAKTNGWSISRYKWYLIIMTAMFCWSWFPDFIMPALSYFAWATWAAPNNVTVNQLFGQFTGISFLFPFTGFTLDWAQINSFYGSPLIAPWHATGNTLIGLVFFLWIVTPALQWTNTWYGQYLPILDNAIFDNTGASYNITSILRPDHSVDPAKYEAYSPLFLATVFALAYGVSFATISSLISHTYLFHGSEIWRRWRASKGELDDIHMKLMRKYKLVPDWWYLLLLLVMVGFAFAAACAYPTNMAWYSVLLSLVIAAVWTIPIGIIQAFTNIQLGLNVFTEFIIGYVQPGHPIAMMMFKTFGYIVMTQALYFCQDLKFGHYMHVPQRSMFMAQFIATVWSCVVQLAVVEWAMTAIKNVCTPEASGFFTCLYIKTFYNASVIWGAIGPAHIFSGDAVYKNLQYMWLVGFFLPFIFYGLARAFPRSSFRKLNAPLIFSCMGYIPPYSAMNLFAYCSVGWIFQKYIRDKYRGWWMEYNYITSAGMDVGLAICGLVIFFCIQLPGKGMPAWWGTNILGATADANGAVRAVPANGTFGPTTWKW